MGYFLNYLPGLCKIIAVTPNSKWPTSRPTGNTHRTEMSTETAQNSSHLHISMQYGISIPMGILFNYLLSYMK